VCVVFAGRGGPAVDPRLEFHAVRGVAARAVEPAGLVVRRHRLEGDHRRPGVGEGRLGGREQVTPDPPVPVLGDDVDVVDDPAGLVALVGPPFERETDEPDGSAVVSCSPDLVDDSVSREGVADRLAVRLRQDVGAVCPLAGGEVDPQIDQRIDRGGVDGFDRDRRRTPSPSRSSGSTIPAVRAAGTYTLIRIGVVSYRSVSIPSPAMTDNSL
jgi:hypothetical protein